MENWLPNWLNGDFGSQTDYERKKLKLTFFIFWVFLWGMTETLSKKLVNLIEDPVKKQIEVRSLK